MTPSRRRSPSSAAVAASASSGRSPGCASSTCSIDDHAARRVELDRRRARPADRRPRADRGRLRGRASRTPSRGCSAGASRATCRASGLGPVEAIEAIRAAGGLPVLAHFGEAPSRVEVVRELADAGLGGLEVYYRSFDAATVVRGRRGRGRARARRRPAAATTTATRARMPRPTPGCGSRPRWPLASPAPGVG